MDKNKLSNLLCGVGITSSLVEGLSRMRKVKQAVFDVDYLIGVKQIKGKLKHFKRLAINEDSKTAFFQAQKDIKRRTKVGELVFIPQGEASSKRFGVDIPINAIRCSVWVKNVKAGDLLEVSGFNDGEVSIKSEVANNDNFPTVKLGRLEEVNYVVDGVRKVAQVVSLTSVAGLVTLLVADSCKK